MAHLSTLSALNAPVCSSSSIPRPLSRSHLRQHDKDVTVLLMKPKASRPASPERTFLCQDKNYPRIRSRSLQPIQKAYAVSTSSVHWRGDEQALFMLDPAAKYNIRDYLLEQCKARKETSNELKKFTGTKVVFVLQFSDEDGEQEALCVPTTRATLHGIYSIRDDHPTITQSNSPPMFSEIMQTEAPRKLRRSSGTTSFTRLMASTNEVGFPLTDHELDSDSDVEDDHGVTPPPYKTALDAITEDDEASEPDTGFVNVVNLGAPEYCRDPDSTQHPECHGRYKTDSYAHNRFDAKLDFQERFVAAHTGRDSAAYYRNWRTLKLDHGETLVHGQSSLRNPIATPEEDVEHDDLDNSTELLLRLIAEKYGPLTLQGQKSKPAEPGAECSEECSFKVDKYLDQDSEDDLRLSDQELADENEELGSEPSTLFDGVADFSDADASTPAKSESRNAPVMTEEELESIINTPHEDFVNGYVQRYEAMSKKAARAKLAREEGIQSSVASGAVGEVADEALVVSLDTTVEQTGTMIEQTETVAEQMISLPEFLVTAATPASTPTMKAAPSVSPVAVDHEVNAQYANETLSVSLDLKSETIESPRSCSITGPVPTLVSDEIAVIASNEVAPLEGSVRPDSASSSYSSLPASVFSRRASITTRPSNESFWSDNLRLVDTLDLQVDVKLAPTIVSHHERSVSMPVMSLSASDTYEISTNVSESNHGAYARSIYVGSSTPVRTTSVANKYLTPIIEVQTPLSSYPMPPAKMHPRNVMDDPYEDFPTKFNYQQPDFHIPPRAPRPSRDDPLQFIPTSVFTDSSSYTNRRERGDKLASIKHQAQAVASATKCATRRVLRSMKKVCATARSLVPVTLRSRHPYEPYAHG
ncbi:uncharacterized protein M421DRAFT_92885 [Didymella exigua CBS 183.55]|uniref:Uncharacterized protein n=1 Tax=Didymella exigua CBS 183.55 TaxID=1150837 RepID=A0A6A5RIB6_9PLEO|nr:uncharacterized protein M421DRAFT_92885 [Didymella exigua CBS 183.55]KAF1928081.1 hypothetical protein M421DRAFT_92885 [Didymella exigua CBS 183.55]